MFFLNEYSNAPAAAAAKQDQPAKEGKRKNSPYSDIPNDMFYCHLCAKHMWDSTSFENHLKGRTHQVTRRTYNFNNFVLKIFIFICVLSKFC